MTAAHSVEHLERAREIIAKAEQEICELPDRTSPEDWPELMLVTGEELRLILEDDIAAAFAEAEARAFERAAADTAVLEIAAKAALTEFCQPTIAVAWAELQPLAKSKWLRITHVALSAAARGAG